MDLCDNIHTVLSLLPGSTYREGFVRDLKINTAAAAGGELVAISLKGVMRGKTTVNVTRYGSIVEVSGCGNGGVVRGGDQNGDVEKFNCGGTTSFAVADDVADYCLMIKKGSAPELMQLNFDGEPIERGWWNHKLLIFVMLVLAVITYFVNAYYNLSEKFTKDKGLKDFFSSKDLEDIFGTKN